MQRFRVLSLGYALIFALAIAPTLALLQFCRTPENLVIAAAVEMKRDGHWLMPTLEGEPRTAKPPLATWITAGAIWHST
ncbi:MAG: hypothetical protein JO353_06285, partial [Phycisphaerae bacterium]|nr:hypothetical protein [Phycisphaerae bacterium]